jgi:hypothetical protein
MREYEKIETLFVRDEKTKKLIEGKYRNETVEFLKDIDWEFTEKIDGTNIRIYWNGHKVQYFGRTDKAQIPSQLLNKLIEHFGGDVNEEMFEQKFGSMEVMLIGEGYGAKIQGCGSLYREDNDFILFDVLINGNYQSRESVKDIAKYFNLDVVPTIMIGKLEDGIKYVKSKPKSKIGNANSEGLVARPLIELRDRTGNRIIVKIKVKDHESLEER